MRPITAFPSAPLEMLHIIQSIIDSNCLRFVHPSVDNGSDIHWLKNWRPDNEHNPPLLRPSCPQQTVLQSGWKHNNLLLLNLLKQFSRLSIAARRVQQITSKVSSEFIHQGLAPKLQYISYQMCSPSLWMDSPCTALYRQLAEPRQTLGPQKNIDHLWDVPDRSLCSTLKPKKALNHCYLIHFTILPNFPGHGKTR